MNTLIIYDSIFGNTEKIAQAIGQSLAPQKDVSVKRVADVKIEHIFGLKILIVGSPTRAFRPTPAITKFLRDLSSDALKGVKVGAFDTGIMACDIESATLRFMVKIGGYAAKPIATLLEKKGGELVVPPQGFFVKGEEGPLKDGELERAAAWARAFSSEGETNSLP